MFGGRAWRFGRIGGVAIFVDPSVLVLGLLISVQTWQALSSPFRFPGLSPAGVAAFSALTATLFIGSILAHELAHAGMSLARGIPVRGVTLYMLGGATHQREAPKRPVDEFLVTVVGPVTTAALGAGFLLLHAAGRTAFSPPWRAVFGYLALVNLLMAGLNLLPGFPLDGGRLVLSGVWRATGDRERALRVAARIGQVVAGLIIAAGLALAFTADDLVFGLWAAFIGWFLYQAATAALTDGSRRRLLSLTTVAEVMSTPPPSVPAGMSVGAATDRYLRGHDGEAFPVVEDGHAVGFVSLRTVRGAAPDRPVREAMAGPEAVVEARPDEPMDAVAARLEERHVETVLVFDEGRLVGLIEPEDLRRMLRRHRTAARKGTP